MPDTKLVICKTCKKEFEVPLESRASICSECKKKRKTEARKKRKGMESKTPAKKTNTSKANKQPVKKNKPLPTETLPAIAESINNGVDLDSLFPAEIWEERPVDIETFLFNRDYLGNAWLDGDGNKTMFPSWQDYAKKIFPLPMKSPYNTVILSGATGLGKTSIAMGVCCAYYLYIVMCLRNPHEYFGLADQKPIIFANINIVTKTMAYKNAWGMIHKMLISSPWFMQRGNKTTGKRQEWYCTTKPVELIYGRGPDDLIGLDILFCFMDEISFYRNQSVEKQIEAATEVFNSAWERMKSRYIKFGGIFDGLMVMASSKRTDQSFMESFIKTITDGVDAKRVLIIDRARWEMLPESSYSGKKFPVAVGDKFRPSQIIREEQLEEFKNAGYKIIWPPIENYAEFERDMNNALTNIAGISVGQISSFIRGDLVTSCIDGKYQNLITKSVIFSGYKDPDQYYEYVDLSRMSQEDFTLPLFVHLDASLGRDGNSIVGVVADYAVNQANSFTGNYEVELHYRELFKLKIRAPQGTHTGLNKNKQFILWLNQHFNLQGVSRDQYQSEEFHQDLDRLGIKVTKQSIDSVTNGICQPYEILKNAMYEKRVTLLDDEDQTNELVSLEKHESGKVDKPQGGHDDTSQCLAGAIYLASKAKEEIMASGAVLLKQLDSSKEITGNSLPPAEVVAREIEQHFASYSPEAKVVSQKSELRDSWDAFFGGANEKKRPDESFNISSRWG